MKFDPHVTHLSTGISRCRSRNPSPPPSQQLPRCETLAETPPPRRWTAWHSGPPWASSLGSRHSLTVDSHPPPGPPPVSLHTHAHLFHAGHYSLWSPHGIHVPGKFRRDASTWRRWHETGTRRWLVGRPLWTVHAKHRSGNS